MIRPRFKQRLEKTKQTEKANERLMSQDNDIVVFISTGNSTCGECGQELGRRARMTLDRIKNALCLPGPDRG
jgi:hypothetical protein